MEKTYFYSSSGSVGESQTRCPAAPPAPSSSSSWSWTPPPAAAAAAAPEEAAAPPLRAAAERTTSDLKRNRLEIYKKLKGALLNPVPRSKALVGLPQESGDAAHEGARQKEQEEGHL